jgi:hypothetical protein
MNVRILTSHTFLEEALNDSEILVYGRCFLLKGARYLVRFG